MTHVHGLVNNAMISSLNCFQEPLPTARKIGFQT